MFRKNLFLLSGFLMFFAFIFFSYLVHENLFTSLDFNTTVRFQDNIPRRLDRVFSWFSVVGNFETMLIVLLAILIFTRKLIFGIGAFILFGGFHFIELFGKFFVDHTPPPEFLLRTERLTNFPQFHVRLENSYPSGHAGRSLFISIILLAIILQSKKLSIPVKILLVSVITCYNIFMLISRIYLGEHWTTDVVGGAILGSALGAISGGLLAGNFKKSESFPSLTKQKKHIQ